MLPPTLLLPAQPSRPRMLRAAGWLAAGEVQHDYALWHLRAAAGEKNVAERQAALLEAGRLLEGVHAAEEALAPWMPAARLEQLADRRKQLGWLLRDLQAGHLKSAGEPGQARLRAGSTTSRACTPSAACVPLLLCVL